jgi:hypothetical protein
LLILYYFKIKINPRIKYLVLGLSFSLPGVQSGVSGAAVRSTVGLPLSSANIISDIEGNNFFCKVR